MPFAPMSPAPPPDSPEAAEARAASGEMFARTNALDQSADFQWFLDRAVQTEIEAAAAKALKITSTDRERDNAAHVHEAMLRVKSWVKENLEIAGGA